MASVSAILPTLSPICRAYSNLSSSTSSSSLLPIPFSARLPRSSHVSSCISMSPLNHHHHHHLSLSMRSKSARRIRSSVAEEQTLDPPPELGSDEEEQPFSVPVSSSDVLTMSFEAEGTMGEDSIDKVTKAVQETEGISNLKVQVHEGIASVQLKKQTTVQATGVASGLVEIIQGSGFKLQTLHLGFEDEEDRI